MIERIKRLPIVARWLRKRHPHNSSCHICGLPWSSCRSHVIPVVRVEESDIGVGRGFFCVCEYCWNHAEKRQVEEGVEHLYHRWCQDTLGNPPYGLTDMYIAFDKEWVKTHKD